MLGSLLLHLRGMRILMFQLSGFYDKGSIRVEGCGFKISELSAEPSS